MMEAAKAAHAEGVTIFRFPEGGASGGGSLAQWGPLLRQENLPTPISASLVPQRTLC